MCHLTGSFFNNEFNLFENCSLSKYLECQALIVGTCIHRSCLCMCSVSYEIRVSTQEGMFYTSREDTLNSLRYGITIPNPVCSLSHIMLFKYKGLVEIIDQDKRMKCNRYFHLHVRLPQNASLSYNS